MTQGKKLMHQETK